MIKKCSRCSCNRTSTGKADVVTLSGARHLGKCVNTEFAWDFVKVAVSRECPFGKFRL